MDPYLEQRLRDEVLYLHSLWHRGPPTVTATHFPHRTPQLIPSTNPQIASGSNQARQKKKKTKTDNRKKKKMTQMADEDQNDEKRQKVPDLGWACVEPRVEESLSGGEWPAFKAKEKALVELTVEEKATMSARRVQQRGVEASRMFFSRNKEDSSDGELESDDESEEAEESEELKFFRELFVGDEELRGYYEKNWGDGEFCCLVCRGNGEKVTKKFRNCVAVVQHCVTISRTLKRTAHRAYGRVICDLLSWDINKLPSDAVKVGDQGGLQTLESKEMTGVMDRGTNGAWDVKWSVDKKRTCTSEWGQFTEPDVLVEKELSEEEEVKVAAARVQERSREAARVFFSRREFVDCDDDSEDGNSMDGGECDECEEYKFLAKLFEEDEELKEYYKRSWASGAFSCLVCWGVVEKVNKKYKNCVALVQHCVSISKTKSKMAHRAYRKVICALLGWDINKLPVSELFGVVTLPKSIGSQVGESSFLKKNSQHPEEPEKDSGWEKAAELPGEPKGDSSVELQINESGWAPFNSTSQSLLRELTVEEQGKMTSMKVHQKSIDATRAFFSRDGGSESDNDSQEEEEEEEENGKDEIIMFFTSLLEEGRELMEYYHKNWENGDFSCLVCGGAGENLTKKFKNLVAVVQHSVTVAKSKRIKAHRSYGQVICKLMNWDIKRLPVIYSPVEDNPESTCPAVRVMQRSMLKTKMLAS